MRTPTLHQTIAERLKALRLERGLSQDTVARTARQAGAAWSQQTVADIERGMRSLPPEDLLFTIPVVYGIAPAELLSGDDWVQLSEATMVRLGVLRRILTGDCDGILDGEGVQVASVVAAPVQEGDATITVTFPRGAPKIVDWQDVQVAAGGAAERKAARKLGVTSVVLSETAFTRWGHSLSAERDARVADQAPEDASPRALQALRGHVTRALLTELAEDLQEGRDDG